MVSKRTRLSTKSLVIERRNEIIPTNIAHRISQSHNEVHGSSWFKMALMADTDPMPQVLFYEPKRNLYAQCIQKANHLITQSRAAHRRLMLVSELAPHGFSLPILKS